MQRKHENKEEKDLSSQETNYSFIEHIRFLPSNIYSTSKDTFVIFFALFMIDTFTRELMPVSVVSIWLPV